MEYVIELLETEIKHLESVIESSYDRENPEDFFVFRENKREEIKKVEAAIATLKASK